MLTRLLAVGAPALMLAFLDASPTTAQQPLARPETAPPATGVHPAETRELPRFTRRCRARVTRMTERRLMRLERATRPTEQQRAAFADLQSAATRAAEVLRAACPTQRPVTLPGRLAAAEKWLDARLQAIRIVLPALEAYYRTLTDEQKIRLSWGPWERHRFHRGEGTGRRGEWGLRGEDEYGRSPGFGPRGFSEDWSRRRWRDDDFYDNDDDFDSDAFDDDDDDD
jgi:hypothetical protein